MVTTVNSLINEQRGTSNEETLARNNIVKLVTPDPTATLLHNSTLPPSGVTTYSIPETTSNTNFKVEPTVNHGEPDIQQKEPVKEEGRDRLNKSLVTASIILNQSQGQTALTLEQAASILGVSESASPKEIKSAFRKLSAKVHPDLHISISTDFENSRLGEAFKALSIANDVMNGDQRPANPRSNTQTGSSSGENSSTGQQSWSSEQRSGDRSSQNSYSGQKNYGSNYYTESTSAGSRAAYINEYLKFDNDPVLRRFFAEMAVLNARQEAEHIGVILRQLSKQQNFSEAFANKISSYMNHNGCSRRDAFGNREEQQRAFIAGLTPELDKIGDPKKLASVLETLVKQKLIDPELALEYLRDRLDDNYYKLTFKENVRKAANLFVSKIKKDPDIELSAIALGTLNYIKHV
jgi:curved DNA-binding protein CbpA